MLLPLKPICDRKFIRRNGTSLIYIPDEAACIPIALLTISATVIHDAHVFSHSFASSDYQAVKQRQDFSKSSCFDFLNFAVFKTR